MHQWTTRGCGVSGGCAALRARSLAPSVAAVPLETQQQSGPVPGGGQHDVQNVIQVQSGAPAPLVAQPEYGEVLTVPGKSMPQLKCAAMVMRFGLARLAAQQIEKAWPFYGCRARAWCCGCQPSSPRRSGALRQRAHPASAESSCGCPRPARCSCHSCGALRCKALRCCQGFPLPPDRQRSRSESARVVPTRCPQRFAACNLPSYSRCR